MLKLLTRLVAALRARHAPPTAAENRAAHAADTAKRAKEAQLRHLRMWPPC